MSDRFVSQPQQFVSVAGPTLVYIGIADRKEFDKISAPVIDRGEDDHGHVLVKQVGRFGANEVTVIFQHWIKSLSAEAFLAERKAARA